MDLFYSTTGTVSKAMLNDSPNADLDKTLLNRYYALPQAENQIQAKYIWIDGTGEYLRSKSRTIDFIPKKPSGNHISILHFTFVTVQSIVM